MRKILIGFASLGVVLGFYLLYIRTSKTPQIDTDRAAKAIKATVDGNAVDPNSEMGKIGDVGIGPVRKARYVTLNEKTKEVEREFGFEKLLHEVGDVWELEKPYVNVYRRNFKCYVTADKGQAQVQTVVGRTTPKDATFSSNVVIHIIPTGMGSFKESFVYLDDIIFLSDKSLLSTAGPIRFESADARMYGTGLELIYNEQAERLEYFKIADLESMSYRVTNSQTALFSSTQTLAEPPVESDAQTNIQEPNETMMVDASDGKEAPMVKTEPPIDQQQLQEGEYYTCILNDNVLIDTPEQLIFANEKFQIHDIFWSKTLIGESDKVDVTNPSKPGSESPLVKQNPQNEQAIADPNISLPESSEPNEAPEETPAFITITCDGGLLIVPRDSSRILVESTEADAKATTSDSERFEQLDVGTERTQFFARTIDYNAVTGDMTAGGLSELTYYGAPSTTNEANPSPDRTGTGPLKVTAHEGATYTKASNQVVFSHCLCAMRQPGLTEQRDVTFSAPEITVDLPEGKSKQPDILAAGPIELAFYMETAAPNANSDPNTSVSEEDANRPPSTPLGVTFGRIPRTASEGALIPVTVNARTRAYYLAALNQMAFEGDCRCTMLREDPNVLEEYVLLSERMTVDLAEDMNDRTSGPAAGLKYLTATGEVVRLATTRMAKAGGAFANALEDANLPQQAAGTEGETKLLGGIELKCRQFDYDAVQQLYWATGPGIIKLNNAIPADPNKKSGPMSLRDPCWAIVSGFDTLRYSLLENRIIADATPQEKLGILYLPTRLDEADGSGTTAGKDTGEITATASHVEALLRETAHGQTELATLIATGGVLYEDDRGHQFIGSELFYDHTTAIVEVRGDKVQSCFYNGILVDQIRYDMNADKVEFNVVGPSSILDTPP